MSDHRNVFENGSTDEDVARNEIRILTHKIPVNERLEYTTDAEMWGKLEEKGFNRNRPITVTEDITTMELTVVQEQY